MNFGGTTLEVTERVESGELNVPACSVSGFSQPVAANARSASRDGGEAAVLGKNADFVPTHPDGSAFLPAPGAVKAFLLRSIGRDLLKSHGIQRRMRWCGSRIAKNADGIGVYRCPDRARGRVTGICVCGQSICCPVCAPRIAAKRSGEVAECFRRMRDIGIEARLETFTKPHRLDMRPGALAREIDSFAGMWRSYMHHADRREKGTLGCHLGREVTWGDNGWHYHHHRLRYDKPGAFREATARAQWLAVLEARGLRSEAAEKHAYDVGPVDDEAGAVYCAKLATMADAQSRAVDVQGLRSESARARSVGREVASGVTKGRSINSLLADFAAGDEMSGVVWLNGVSVITARKVSSVRWSCGLEARVGMDRTKTDVALAKDEACASDQFLGALNPWQWQGVLKWRAELALLLAANQGLDSVNSFLAGLELGQLNDEDPRLVWKNKNKRDSENVDV